MRYQAVLYDMDGTVLDTLDDLADAVNHSLEQFGLPRVSRDHVRANLGNGAANLVRQSVPAGSDEALVARLIAYYRDYYDAHCRIRTRPYDGILPLMERMRAAGVKQAIISNKPDPAVRELAEHFFPGLLETAVGESATVRRKPNPDAVLAAVEQMGLTRADCVYVGDTEVDIQTGQNAGMDVIAVAWGFRDEDQLIAAGAKELVHDAEQLEKALRGSEN